MEEQPVKILVVEDNPADARLLEETLKDAPGGGFELTVAERLSDGLRLAHEGFDIVLLDLRLPDSEGFDTFERMHDEVPDVPIVVLSGMSDETLAVRAVQQGAQDYMVKGQVDGERLARSLRYAIARHKTQQRLLGRYQPAMRGRVIGFLGAKGGVGTTTVVLNTAMASAVHGKQVIAAELRPYFGTFALSLGKTSAKNISHLADLDPDQINALDLAPWLASFEHGLRTFFGAQNADQLVDPHPDQIEAISEKLAMAADFVFADMGSCPSPQNHALISHCDVVVIVLHPDSTCLETAQSVAGVVRSWGISGERLVALIVNRGGLGQALAPAAVGAELDCGIIGVVPPVDDDLIMMASKRATPLVLAFPDSIASTSFAEIAARLTSERVTPLTF